MTGLMEILRSFKHVSDGVDSFIWLKDCNGFSAKSIYIVLSEIFREEKFVESLQQNIPFVTNYHLTQIIHHGRI